MEHNEVTGNEEAGIEVVVSAFLIWILIPIQWAVRNTVGVLPLSTLLLLYSLNLRRLYPLPQ